MDLRLLDVTTLSALAGDAASDYVLEHLRTLGHTGVRLSHGYVFQRLLATEPTVGELAESLAITQQGASKHVAQLEALGWVDRFGDAHDARVRRIRLTAAGRRVVEDARRVRAELDERLSRQVRDGDLAATRRTLVALLELTGGDVRARDRRVPLDGRG
ncbi:MarR family transcriptional regulator [Agromyces sp. H66]|uniref:MarR family winged helix-turn-helix transcriptional regulator n=1 Tax=Agromyces sp. H66 TaxID=2529859 RepID=UPI001B7D8134|nr:MarR family transcriptional regulator [Agromyces sp. H66]